MQQEQYLKSSFSYSDESNLRLYPDWNTYFVNYIKLMYFNNVIDYHRTCNPDFEGRIG